MCVKKLIFRIFDSPMILLVLTPHPLYGFFGFLLFLFFTFFKYVVQLFLLFFLTAP